MLLEVLLIGRSRREWNETIIGIALLQTSLSILETSMPVKTIVRPHNVGMRIRVLVEIESSN
jgi:hypothetical protein